MNELRISMLRLWPLLVSLVIGDQLPSDSTYKLASLVLLSVIVASSLLYFLLTHDRCLQEKQRAHDKQSFRYI